MSIFLTGDTHGDNLNRLSYRWYPQLRSLTEKDILIILGDTAVGWPAFDDTTKYELNTIQKTKPFEVWFLAGNHDNYDYMDSLPIVNHYGGKMRQVVWDGITYNNFYAIPDPTIVTIENQTLLLIPHAESHDIQYLAASDDKTTIEQYKRENKWFRIIGKTWWAREKLDIEELQDVVGNHTQFDYVLSHDAPGSVNDWYKRPGEIGRSKSTEGQQYLDNLRKTLDFKRWYHGHFHFDADWPKPHPLRRKKEYYDSRVTGLYAQVIKLGDSFSD